MGAEAQPLPAAERQGPFIHPLSGINKMILRLHNDALIHDLRDEFAGKFPGLKLDFIFHGDEKLNLSSLFNHPFSCTQVKEICPDCAVQEIIIDEDMTTKEVEELFENSWHLPAQVYARVDGYWQKNRETETSSLKEIMAREQKN